MRIASLFILLACSQLTFAKEGYSVLTSTDGSKTMQAKPVAVFFCGTMNKFP